jgi:hypothetical protein
VPVKLRLDFRVGAVHQLSFLVQVNSLSFLILATVLLALAAGVFAMVYIVQTLFAWRSTNWTKISSNLCVGAAVASAMLPSLKLVFDFTGLGKLEAAVDQSPIATITFLVAAVAFGWMQVYRERHNLHEHG